MVKTTNQECLWLVSQHGGPLDPRTSHGGYSWENLQAMFDYCMEGTCDFFKLGTSLW